MTVTLKLRPEIEARVLREATEKGLPVETYLQTYLETAFCGENTSPLTLQERRAFLRLPLAERRRLLAEQAERMATHYEQNTEWRELLEGDIVDY